MTPKVTVIVPIYKVEKYLERCLNSIINQTYKNLEIILVNDGSPDGCGEICEKYRLNDKRVIVINKENGGLSSARNRGLDVATGEYIGFVDSDDWIDLSMYENLVQSAIKYNADIVQCGFQTVLENNDIEKVYKFNEKIYNNKDEIFKAYFCKQEIATMVWNKLYKKEVFNGIRMIEGRNNEDTMVTPELLMNIKSLYNIEELSYNYFKRENTITSSSFSNKNLDQIYAGEYVINLFENNFDKYTVYSRINMCLICFYMYVNLIFSKCKDKRKYKNIIMGTFKSNYLIVKNSYELRCYNKRDRIIIKGFHLSPNILSYIYKFLKN